jgi:hypothetical protein
VVLVSWLAPPPSPRRASRHLRHDERRVGTFSWPRTGGQISEVWVAGKIHARCSAHPPEGARVTVYLRPLASISALTGTIVTHQDGVPPASASGGHGATCQASRWVGVFTVVPPCPITE